MLKQARAYIKGDVIGVGFRAWVKVQAIRIGVNGWVKNVYDEPEIFGRDGGVEALVQGEEDKVNQILKLLKTGPPVSRVDSIEVTSEEPKEIFGGFEIRR